MVMIKCKDCGAEISSTARACPQCGFDNRSWWNRRNIMSKVVIILIATPFVLGFLGALLDGGDEEPSESVPKEYLDMDFSEFDALFGMDGTLTDLQKEPEFESKYRGKYVTWTCKVEDIRESFGHMKMDLKCNPKTITTDMRVELRKDQENTALSLNKEDYVTFVAKLTRYGEFLGHNADDGIIISSKLKEG